MKANLFRLLFPLLLALPLLLGVVAPDALRAQAGCQLLTFSVQTNGSACCYNLRANNQTDNCFTYAHVQLSTGIFSSFTAAAGYQAQQLGANEYNVTRNAGPFPAGQLTLASFCVTGGQNVVMTVNYENTCISNPPDVLCSVNLSVNTCQPNGKITGVKYVDVGCRGNSYSNQPTLPGWLISLRDLSGNILQQKTTDATGKYQFTSLLPGDYIVSETSQPGWKSSFPDIGYATVNVPTLNSTTTQDFGNCPTTCSCDSIYLHLTQLPGSSDTSSYLLSISNHGQYCFPYVTVKVDTGLLVDWTLLIPGWEASLDAPGELQLNPPGGVVLPGGGMVPLKIRVRNAGRQAITLGTAWGNGFDDTPCNHQSGFTSPPPTPLNTNCCPNGQNPTGTEQVLDGDFLNPPQFASPGYGSVCTGPNSTPAHFCVTTGPLSNLNSFWSLIGTTGPSDAFIAIDGSTTTGINVDPWEQQMTLAPGVIYNFTAEMANLVSSNYNFNDPHPQVWIVDCGGTAWQILTNIPATGLAETGNWFQVCGNWTAPTGANFCNPYTLKILNSTTGQPGNDFGVDKISFRSCSGTQACVPDFTFTGNCKTMQFTNTSTGTGLQYTWNFGDPNSGTTNNTSNLPNPSHTFTNCNQTYTVTLNISGTNCPTTSVSKQVTVSDNQPPTIGACPPPKTVIGLSGFAGCTLTMPMPTVTATDNCPGVTVTNNNPSGFFNGSTTVIYTATDACGNTATCTWPVTVLCADPFCPACPNGQPQGTNLVANGGFESGFNNFSSNFTQFTPGSPTTAAGQYSVLTAAQVTQANIGNWACTPSSGTQMLVLNGGVGGGNNLVWRFPANSGDIPVQSNTNYSFCLNVNNLMLPSLDVIDPVIDLWVIGNVSSMKVATMTLPELVDGWIPLGGIWASGANTQAHLQIHLFSVGANGNDFAVDDISFKSCTASSCSVVINGNATPCSGVGQTLTTTVSPGGGTYSWTGSGTGNGSTLNIPGTNGTYTVTYTVNGQSCSNTLIVTTKPTPTITISGNQACPGVNTTLTANASPSGTYTHQWSYNNLSGQSISVPGTATMYTVTCTLNGCSSSTSTTVTLLPKPTITISGGGGTYCGTKTVTLTASGGNNCTWNTTPIQFGPSITVTVASTTSYIVTCTGTNGCTNTATTTITITPPPVLNITPPQTICQNTSGTITVSLTPPGGATYLWSSTGSITNSTTLNSLSVGGPYYYTVTVTPTGCAAATASSSITVVATPSASITPQNSTVCQGAYTTLTATAGGTSYIWSNPVATGNPITVQMNANTQVSVVVSFGNNCTATAMANVSVINCSGCPMPPNPIVQNGKFTNGTATTAQNDIANATGWNGIWPVGSGYGSGELCHTGLPFIPNSFWNTACNNTSQPTPTTQGNYASFLSYTNLSSSFFRQGIKNQLAIPIPKNSGTYTLWAQVASLMGLPWGINAHFEVWGTDNTGLAPTPTALTQCNSALFPAGTKVKWLCDIGLPNATCQFIQRSGNFTAPTFDITSIFLTRPDPISSSCSGGTGAYLNSGGLVGVDDICIEPTGIPPACTCGSGLAKFYQWGSSFSTPILACGNNPVQLPCPSLGTGYGVNVAWLCLPLFSCPASAATWTLSTVSGPPVSQSGTVNSNGWLNLPNSWFGSGGGSYQIALNWSCGGSACNTCVFSFTTATCNCPCTTPTTPLAMTLATAVNQGFSLGTPWNSTVCVRKFFPAALCANDMVRWDFLDASGNLLNTPNSLVYPNPRTTQGNAVALFDFPTGFGSYQVRMTVTRKQPSGLACPNTALNVVSGISQWYFFSCSIQKPDDANTTALAGSCPMNEVKNGDFTEGIVAGPMTDVGRAANWDMAPNYGNGFVYVQDNVGANDPGHLIFYGGKDRAAGIMQPVTIPWDKFVNLRYSLTNYQGPDLPPSTNLEFWLQDGPFPDDPTARLIYREEHLDTSLATWSQRTFSPTTSFGPDPYSGYLVIRLTSADTIFSVIGLDNLEICTAPTVETGQAKPTRERVRVIPNPNPGQFTVELTTPATAKTVLKITDLAGQTVFEKQADPGSDRQTVHAERLAPGLYFLQVISEGKLLAVEKFVKQ